MQVDEMANTEKPRNLGGRPRKEITPAQVEAAAAYRLNHRQLAAILGCNRKTIQNRMHEDPEYREAYERGRAMAESEILQLLYSSARMGNVKAQMFLAQSLLGLSNRETVRHEGEINTRYVVELPAEAPAMDDWQRTFRPGTGAEPSPDDGTDEGEPHGSEPVQ
jgi:hypothetical protein